MGKMKELAFEKSVQETNVEDSRTYGEGYEAGLYDAYTDVLKELNGVNMTRDVYILTKTILKKIHNRFGMENTHE